MTRADILNAMKARFTAMSTGSGYNYTVSKCGLFDVIPTPKSTNLFVSIVDKGQSLIEANYGGVNPDDLEMEVDIICRLRVPGTGQETNYTLAPAKMTADIRRAIGTDDTWGGKAFLTKYIQDTSDIQFGETIIVQSTVTIAVQFRVLKWSN